MEKAVLRKRLIVSPIWFLPLLAFCIGIWLLITSYLNSGIAVTIQFPSAEGITAGKTKVMYKGIPVGTVTDVAVNHDMDGAVVQVELDRGTKRGLVEDTVFWIVKPKISAGRISGLDTLVSGAYITLRMGSSEAAQRKYTGLLDPPTMPDDTPGLHLHLTTDALYYLRQDSYIYSRNMQIGRVEDYRLEENGSITVDIFIKPKFSHLVREETRFWNTGGLAVTGDLQSGLSVKLESMASLIYGGLSCGTPEELDDSPQAQNGQVFRLYKNFEDARHGIPMTLRLASGEGIIPGKTKVMLRGIKVGIVRSIDLHHDQPHSVTAHILLDPMAEGALRENSKFWLVRPQISFAGIQHPETLLSGAYISLRAGDGAYQNSFVVESAPMPTTSFRPGKRFTLHSEDGTSMRIGSPVLYQKREVGQVTDIHLSGTGHGVELEILLYDYYTGLTNRSTRFYTVSGLSITASLQGISLQSDSLDAIAAGGISFITPHDDKPLAEDRILPLYANRKKALQADALFLDLEFSDSNGITEQTKIKYKGIVIGTVTEIRYDPAKDRAVARAAVDRAMAQFFRRTTALWLVRPKVDLSGIKHLGTLLSGAYITLLPGRGGKKTHFTVENAEPNLSGEQSGLNLVLEATRIGSLKKGSPIYYRQVEIGQVTGLELGPTAQNVWIHLVVDSKYHPLVRRSSRFWNAGGVRVIAGLFSGVSVETESLESIVAGGIAMATPDDLGTSAQNGDHFILADKPQEAWLNWAPKIKLFPQNKSASRLKQVQPEMKKIKIR